MIDIFIPVYNEGENIETLFDELSEKVLVPFEVLIVYDFLEDNTIPVIDRIRNNYSFGIRLEKNRYGKGANGAFRTGMESTVNEAVVFTMADLSDSIETINDMYEKITSGYDMVSGSRYIKGGSKKGDNILKTFFSKIAGNSLHFLIGIPTHDISNGYKMYRKEVVDNIKLESRQGFEIIVELAIKAYLKGYNITEVPARWKKRDKGKSSFKMWKWIPHYLHWYFWGIKNKRTIRERKE